MIMQLVVLCALIFGYVALAFGAVFVTVLAAYTIIDVRERAQAALSRARYRRTILARAGERFVDESERRELESVR